MLTHVALTCSLTRSRAHALTHSLTPLRTRCQAAFDALDADGSGALDMADIEEHRRRGAAGP